MNYYKSWLLMIFLSYSANALADHPATEATINLGRELYETNCAACHGTNGKGGVGIPLSYPSFIDSVSDSYLRKSIRYGRPGRVMPSFTNLSDNEILYITQYMRTWTGKPGKTYSNKNIKGSIRRGKKLFNENCISCHSQGGTGGVGTGVTFSRPRDSSIIAPSLNNPGFLSSAEDHFIKDTLMHGRAGTPMKSYLKSGMSEQDINDIVRYIRDFEGGPYPYTTYETDVATIKVESPYDFKTTLENLRRAIIGKNFKVIREQSLDEGLVEKDQENTKQVIVYFCNFRFLNNALAIDPRIGIFLPCRVTVVEQEGKVYLLATNPLVLSNIFSNRELNEACKEMYSIYKDLLDEASL